MSKIDVFATLWLFVLCFLEAIPKSTHGSGVIRKSMSTVQKDNSRHSCPPLVLFFLRPQVTLRLVYIFSICPSCTRLCSFFLVWRVYLASPELLINRFPQDLCSKSRQWHPWCSLPLLSFKTTVCEHMLVSIFPFFRARFSKKSKPSTRSPIH